MNFDSDENSKRWMSLWRACQTPGMDHWLPEENVPNAYFIYATVGPDAQPEFCVPSGEHVRGGDIYTSNVDGGRARGGELQGVECIFR